jgi:hypothetical protein
MKNKLLIAVAGIGLLLGTAPIWAHHAFAAEFDVNSPVTVKGTITKVEWVNPHAWLYVDVTDPDGKVTNWHFELGPPNALFRLGWKKNSIQAGTAVTVTGFKAKGSENTANGRAITLPDGKELFSGGSGPNSGQPGGDAPK